MARLETADGRTVRMDDDWLSVDQNEKGDKFFYFFTDCPLEEHLARHWRGHEVRFDEQGREWTRRIPHLVVDDFGALVEVPA